MSKLKSKVNPNVTVQVNVRAKARARRPSRGWLAALLTLGCLWTAKSPAQDDRKPGPTVAVATEAVGHEKVERSISAFGVVTAPPGVESTMSIPHGGRLQRLAVSVGQSVARGAVLFELARSEADRLTYEQARSGVVFQQGELDRTQALLQQQLATVGQVAAAQKALSDAQTTWAAQQRIGAGEAVQTFRADAPSVVTAVIAARGDVLAAGAPVLKLTAPAGMQVVIGVEPEAAADVRAGMDVQMTPLFGSGKPTPGQVVAVHAAINPQTHLVDVVVKPARPDASLMLGTHLKAQIVESSGMASTVARSAVLTDAKGSYVYQVRAGKATRVAVHATAEVGARLAVEGALDQKLPVVVQGNYELVDGMAVGSTAR